nr:hypothetical protein [Tanacetum cinerariifolium]
MSRDVITVGSTMRISLLYRGEYSQWRERFMNYLEEQTDGEAMINSIQNGDQPLPVIAQVSLAGNAQNAPPTLKDLKFWTAEEIKTRKIDRLARSLLIQGLPNDIYSLIDSNETAKDLWDALERQTKNLMDINIDALYNILKQNQGDVNDALGYKKKAIVITSDLLALVAEKTNVSKQKEKVVVSSDSEGSDSDESSSSAEETIAEDQLKVKHVVIETHTECQAQYAKLEEERYEYMIRYYVLCDNDKQHRKKIDKQKILFDKMSLQLVEMNNNVLRLQEKILEKETKNLGVGTTIHMIMPSKDTLYNGRKGIGFENPSYFEKAIDLRPSLYDEKVIGLGYTLMFLIHSDEALEIEKFKRARENKFEFAYDYGNLNASYVNEKINLSDDYNQEIINPDFEKIDSSFQQTSSLKPYVPTVILEKIIIDLEDEVVSLLEKEKANLKTIESLKSKGFESSENTNFESENQSENDCLVVEKECNQMDNPKVISPGMFKLSVSQSVSPISMLKTSCDSKNVENLDTFSSVRRTKQSSVIWKKKRSSNTSNVDLSSVSHLKLNKNVKRYSRKDLLSCNNSHLGETGKIHQKHHKSKTAFASNKPLYLLHMDLCGPMHVESINGKRYVLVVVDDYSRYTWVFFLHSKDETLDVIISFIKKTQVNLQLQVQRVRIDNGTEFKNKTLAKFFDEVGITQQIFTARTPQQNSVVEKRNRTLVEAARTMLTFANLPLFLWAEAIATACFTQNRSIIHKRFDETPYELINKRKPNIKFFSMFGCRCYLLNDYEDIGKLKEKGDIGVFIGYSKESVAFRIYNKRTRKIHESVNVNFDEISEMASKQFSLEPDLSKLNKTRKYSNPSVSQVSETSKKDLEDLFQNFYDEYFDSSKIMKSSTTNVETSNV